MNKIDCVFAKLEKSKFRSRFSLGEKERNYINEKGMATIERHAHDFISVRLAPAEIPNDGKQTPYRGHPVFIAEHATATCCRECLEKWHGIEKGRALSQAEQDYVVAVIMAWIKKRIF